MGQISSDAMRCEVLLASNISHDVMRVMASTLLFGGWYASTHPTTGNNLVITRIVRLLRVLTCGITDAPSPNLKSDGITQETEEDQEALARSILSGR